MKITVVAVGKIKEKFYTQAIEEYTKRLSRYCKLQIVQVQDEKTPDEARAWLTSFDGVGLKTASIVMVFSLGMPAFPVDTHIYRVSGRLGLRPEKMDVDHTHMLMLDLFPPEVYGPAHISLILLGRRLCDARKPKCSECFLSDLCDMYREQQTTGAKV